MGSKSPLVILMMVTLVCSIIPALGAALPPSAFAQQEETSLGEEEESLADSIISNVLDDQNVVEQDNISDQDAVNLGLQDQDATQDAEVAQDATNTDVDSDFQQGFAQQADDDSSTNIIDEPEPQCSLEITADKEIYGPGDVVVITITNTGDEPLEFPNSALGLQIKNVDTGEVFPLVALQVVTTLEPGESRTFEFTYEDLVSEIGTGLISATVTSECGAGVEEVTFRLSEAPPPEEDGKIAFASQRDGNWEIYVMNADGTGQTRLTNNPASDHYVDWGPAVDTD